MINTRTTVLHAKHHITLRHLSHGISDLWALTNLVANDNQLSGRLPDIWDAVTNLEVV